MKHDIAVIGMDCKFPSSNNPWELWNLISSQDNAIKNISNTIDPKELNNASYVPYKGLLDHPYHFEHDFFGISAGEAKLIDPQHRIFFQTAYRALESAGYEPKNMQETTGVFASCGFPGYLIHHLLQNDQIIKDYDIFTLQLMNEKDFLATRLAYLLNFKGPAMSVQSACSSSLLAVHLACQSLLKNECQIALAGGVSISFPIHTGYEYQEGSIHSKDGRICSFDRKATGTVRGDGAGVVVLKRVKDAIEAKDTILAVIKGSAVNNDGRNKVSFTAPGVAQQTAVIKEALERADLHPEDIDFIETHGTGTKLGDPIEVKALHEVFKGRKNPLVLSSIKPHVGHLDAASGIASFIKLCLAIHYKTLLHTLNFVEFNPLITPFSNCFTILKKPVHWTTSSHYASGITSLGMGGTNVHIILQGVPLECEKREMREGKCFVGVEHVIHPNKKILRTEAQSEQTFEDVVKRSWQKVLCCERIEMNDNFFELGGSSFLAIQCLAQLPKEIKSVVGVIDFFQYPTLCEFLDYIKTIKLQSK